MDAFAQKLTRSSKTLVKAAPAATTAIATTATAVVVTPGKKSRPLVIDDSSSEAEEAVPLPPPARMDSMAAAPSEETASEPSPKRAKTASSSAQKFNYREYMQRRAAGPSAPGSKEVPAGSPECLAGLTFVFTGELSSMGREDAQDLVKRHGGRVTSAPSGRTDYVVVGEGAGAAKLEKVKALGIKTLDEDGLFVLIKASKGVVPPEPEKDSPTTRPAKASKVSSPKKPAPPKKLPSVTTPRPEAAASGLWTDKYAPRSEEELIGNHSHYERLLEWLRNWEPAKANERAVLISGPPGIGKTTAAHLAARHVGYEIVEMNASDTRSKSSLHEHVRDILDNRSLAGFFASTAVPTRFCPLTTFILCRVL